MRLTENRGAFSLSGASYSIEVTSTLRIEGGATPLPGSGATGVLVRGKLLIRNNRVTGSMDQFGFILSGAEFRLTNPRFLDNRIIADQASLTIPTGGSSVTASANGIEIGGSAGFKFRQPTIQMSDFVIGGVGIQNPRLKFEQGRNGGFTLTGGATLQFVQFSVAGEFTIIRRNNALEFSPVHLDFRATPGIPLGQSGLELTRITGDFNLSQGTAVIQMGVRIESQAKVIIPIVSMDGTITLQVLPRFDLRATAGVQVVGITVSTADLHLTARSASLKGTLEFQIARQVVDLSFGLDADDEFTLFGSLRGELGLRKGSLVHWCVPFAGCVDVPPSTYTLASVTYDAGKFRDRRPGQNNRVVWGGRAQFTVFGNRAYAFLRLAPTPNTIVVGTDLDDYRPVAPARLAAGADWTPSAVDYIAADGMRQFEITRSAELLVFGEVVTPTNIGLPAQPLQVVSPAGEHFTLQPTHTEPGGSFRLYAIDYPTPTQAVGTWTVNLAAGNAVKMWGQKPGIQITRFTAREAGGNGDPFPPAGGTPSVVLANGDPVQFDIQAVRSEPGMEIQLFAEDPQGARFPILEAGDASTTTLAIDHTWIANLPSGTYTLTVIADAFGSSLAATSTAPIQVADADPPAPPSNLAAEVQLDGSVRLAWAGGGEPDLAGYQFAADGGAPIPVEGARNARVFSGLAPGSPHTLTVRAYDTSGNAGAAAETAVNLPLFRLESVTPFPSAAAVGVRGVAAAFNQPILDAALTLVDSQNQVVPAASAPLTVEQAVDAVDVIGAQLDLGNPLPAGVYTATLQAHALDGQPLAWRWSFTAELRRVYVPIAAR
jgi:hypothetical protein